MRGNVENPATPGSRKRIYAIAGLVLAAGIGTAVYFAINRSTPSVQTSAAPKTVDPPLKPEVKSDKNPEKVAEKKEEPRTPVAKKGRAIPVLTGGFKLPEPPANAAKITKFTKRITIAQPANDVRVLRIASGEAPLAALLVAGDKGIGGLGAKDFLDRFNLDTGAKVDRTEIDADGGWPRSEALSPSGDAFVSEGPHGTLTLYSLNEKAKVGSGFRPFGEDKTALAAVYFVDDKTVLAIAVDGRLSIWTDGKQIAEGTIGGPVRAGGLAMKANRDMLLAVTGGSLVTVSTKSLQATPGIALPRAPGDIYAIAYGGGDRVAVAYQTTSPGLQTVIVIGAVGESKPTSLVFDESYGLPEQLDWNGADSFSFTTNRGISATVEMFEVKRPIALLSPKQIKPHHLLVHGKHYFWMTDPSDEKKCVIAEVDFPPDDLVTLMNEERATKLPAAFLLLADGYGR